MLCKNKIHKVPRTRRKNHESSSGKMEVDSVQEMSSRSEEKFGVKYGNYIGDGDSKTCKGILELNPY